jgi:hypothetical protein
MLAARRCESGDFDADQDFDRVKKRVSELGIIGFETVNPPDIPATTSSTM